MKVSPKIGIVIGVMTMAAATGCSSTTGWEFAVRTVPVNEIHHEQGLAATDASYIRPMPSHKVRGMIAPAPIDERGGGGTF